MDNFSLIPYDEVTSLTLDVEHNDDRLLARRVMVYSPPRSSGDGPLYDSDEHIVHCFTCSIPQDAVDTKRTWTWSISSDFDTADLFLPATSRTGNFEVSFRYSRVSEESWERPALIMHVQSDSDNFEVRVVDPIRDEDRQSLPGTLRGPGYHYLRKPHFLRIGPYQFQFGYPCGSALKHPKLVFEIQSRVAHISPMETETEIWHATRELGAGGSDSIVKLAVGMKSGMLRAVKRFKVEPEDTDKQQQVDLEIHHLRFVSLKSQENIVKFCGSVFNISKQGRQLNYQLFFQACHGDVQQLIKLGVARAFFSDLAKQVNLGLKHIHGLGMLHRDLKPGNIFYWIHSLGEAGFNKSDRLEALASRGTRLKFCIGDFDRARISDGDCVTYCGTQLYMPPEIHEGNPYNKSVDIYSYGMTLICLFEHDDIVGLWKKAPQRYWHTRYRSRERWFLAEVQALPPPLCANTSIWRFLQRMIRTDPSQRPSLEEVSMFFETTYAHHPRDRSPMLTNLTARKPKVGQLPRILRESFRPKTQSVSVQSESSLRRSRSRPGFSSMFAEASSLGRVMDISTIKRSRGLSDVESDSETKTVRYFSKPSLSIPSTVMRIPGAWVDSQAFTQEESQYDAEDSISTVKGIPGAWIDSQATPTEHNEGLTVQPSSQDSFYSALDWGSPKAFDLFDDSVNQESSDYGEWEDVPLERPRKHRMKRPRSSGSSDGSARRRARPRQRPDLETIFYVRSGAGG